MSNSSDTSPDHAAEITRADNAIRALEHARAALKEARSSFEDAFAVTGDARDLEALAKTLASIESGYVATLFAIRRETARRDAAELAMKAEAT